MRILQFALLAPVLCLTAWGQTATVDVGTGAPNSGIQLAYLQAFYRNGFLNLVSLPPLANVKPFGTTGLVQEFADAAKSQTNKYALIKANANAPITQTGGDVVQVYAGIYTYYNSIGPNNAGYPTIDTQNCPNLVSLLGNSCQYQLFDKPYALFVYKIALPSGTANFATRDPFYTKWQSLGGISSAGPATSAEQTITAASGIAATLQTFDQAAVFNITSGTLAGRLVGVAATVYAAYSSVGGYMGFLGLPVSDEMLQPDGTKRQIFEGGFVDYTPGSPAVAKRGIFDIVIAPTVTSFKLNLGDSLTLTATPYDDRGNPLTERPVVWSTSNNRVASIQPNGQTVTVKAVGGGSATITANAEGKASTPVSVVVNAPCCGLGEGAPSPAIRQSFQDAVARNRLSVQLPAPTPVQRLGNGYVQYTQDAATGAPYLVAIADRSSTAYVLSGTLLAKYLDLGGPSGPLGYPVSDATAGGRQLFEKQIALAGDPVQSVSGSFLTKWASLNYETGPAGPPTSDVSSILSFQATQASLQSFRNGILVSVQSGPATGKVFFVSGPVVAAYWQTGGPAGTLGLPLNDEFVPGAKRRQDFEGGFIDYSPGDVVGLVHPGDRHPLVTATPSQALTGSRIRLSIGGFDPGSTVRVSVAGQPDFTVKTAAGAYVWEALIPASAKTGLVAIHAVDVAQPSVSADGSYTVRSPAEVVFQVSKVSGDGQSGSPGAALPQPLKILVKDDAGNPVPGLQVSFASSPGAQLVSAATVTDANGQADAVLRLPPTDGIALATATAGRQVVTFNEQAVHSSLLNFPKVSQVADVPLGNGPDTITRKGSMLASASAILRYYQNRADLPNANGFADPVLLNQYLKSFCVPDSQSAQTCDGFVSPPDSREQFVNLWRLAAFVGGSLDVEVEKNDLATVRDLLGQGSPVLLGLPGSHFVVATGVAADGSILVMDPDPATARTTITEQPIGVIRLIPRAPVSRGFLVTGDSSVTISSPVGTCGTDLDLGPQTVQHFYVHACDGSQSAYELDVTGANAFRLTLTDLGSTGKRVDLSGSGPSAYSVFRAGTQWTAAPANLSFASAGIVNAASFTPDLAPGGLFTIFGSGLARADTVTAIEIAGQPAPVVAQSAFQVSGQIPADLAAGTYAIRVTSPYGVVEQPLTIQPVAPEIFRVSGQSGAILNQNGTLNTPSNAAPRGQTIVIFATGLGAVVNQGTLKVTQTPVTVVLPGAELKPSFAGLAPGFIGLYQINVVVPASTPPGLRLLLYLRQNDLTSNPVEVAIQ